MKTLKEIIIEKLTITKDSKINNYNYCPKTKKELTKLLDKLIKERGNNADLNDIDTSEITSMSNLFSPSIYNYAKSFNGNISGWDVSKVKYMDIMFSESIFNGDISNWNVSNVIDMGFMFYNSKFNGDISKWNVSNVKNMHRMFSKCPLEKNPPKWYKK